MATSPPNLLRKRRLLGLAALWPWIAACTAKAGNSHDPQHRFKGLGIVLVVDAVPGAEMDGVSIYDDRAVRIYGKSLVSKGTREILALGGTRVPLTTRVVWRDQPKTVWSKSGGLEYEGTVVGDYTITVAERIPDEILADIRAHGGSLRLKFRLKPDGVLFGWDIERRGGGISRFDQPGGDFLETWY